jgi:aminoglycoside phosphotransferase (APT) family kinase protein
VDIKWVQEAALAFSQSPDPNIEPLGNGLIHQTYKLAYPSGQASLLLQALNRSVFNHPAEIVRNYTEIYRFLGTRQDRPIIPAPVPAKNGQLLWTDGAGNCWRAMQYIENSFSPMIAADENEAFRVSKSFAAFTASLSGLDMNRLKIILPGFHDLSMRFLQFEDSIAKAPIDRLLKSTHIIAEIRERKSLVELYERIRNSSAYPSRVMHHDCKISNILFEQGTGKILCPIDLDTVMPGKFFSDPGDMIRTMACSLDENSTKWEEICIKPSYYQAILEGYLEGMGNLFTKEEKTKIHQSGRIMIYMQSIRFLRDFLDGDKYYKTEFAEQNLNRSLNQILLLGSLESQLGTGS